jgi:hypothetical protein
MALLQSLPSTAIHILIIYLTSLLTKIVADSTISIIQQPAYSQVRPCVQPCLLCTEYWLQNCPGGAIGLGNVLSCDDLDAIYCRTDLQSSAFSYLTTCLNSMCSENAVDVSDGFSLYSGYCHVDGATLDNFPTTGVAGGAGNTGAAAPGSTPTIITTSTVISGSLTVPTTFSE